MRSVLRTAQSFLTYTGHGKLPCITVSIVAVSLQSLHRAARLTDGDAGFYRDMAINGPYFSYFLLYVVFSHALRHTRQDEPRWAKYEKGEFFLQKAKNLLLNEFEMPKVPTIQGLLILGGRQCAIGKASEGWLYTGMAISMIKDLGFHLHREPNALLHDLEPDDLEARKRLCLSAYVWEKSISLCLGRSPSFTELPHQPNSLLDDGDNQELWYPRHLQDSNAYYPHPTLSHTTETFMYFAEIAVVINDMYATIYDSRSRERINTSRVFDIERRLLNIYESLPAHLRFVDMDQACPPSHILNLNIIYHTVRILLFRPFYLSQSQQHSRDLVAHAHQTCAVAAQYVNTCFQSYGRTFQYRNQTYLLSYCVYTAATIEINEIRSADREIAASAMERLKVTLQMLEAEASQTPGIRSSVDIIRSRIHRQSGVHASSAGVPHGQPVITSNALVDQHQEVDGMENTMGHDVFAGQTAMLQPQDEWDDFASSLWWNSDGLDLSGGFGILSESADLAQWDQA